MDGDLAAGPMQAAGLYFLGAAFYPGLVGKDEHLEISREYFRKFHGLELE